MNACQFNETCTSTPARWTITTRRTNFTLFSVIICIVVAAWRLLGLSILVVLGFVILLGGRRRWCWFLRSRRFLFRFRSNFLRFLTFFFLAFLSICILGWFFSIVSIVVIAFGGCWFIFTLYMLFIICLWFLLVSLMLVVFLIFVVIPIVAIFCIRSIIFIRLLVVFLILIIGFFWCLWTLWFATLLFFVIVTLFILIIVLILVIFIIAGLLFGLFLIVAILITWTGTARLFGTPRWTTWTLRSTSIETATSKWAKVLFKSLFRGNRRNVIYNQGVGKIYMYIGMYVYLNLNFVCSISMICLWLDYQKKYRRNSNIKKFIVFNHCERSIAVIIIIIIKMGFRLPPTLSMDYGQFFTRIQFWQVFVLIIFFILLRAGYFFLHQTYTPNVIRKIVFDFFSILGGVCSKEPAHTFCHYIW